MENLIGFLILVVIEIKEIMITIYDTIMTNHYNDIWFEFQFLLCESLLSLVSIKLSQEN